MALVAGNSSASSGMSKAIYDTIREVMEPIDGVEGQALEDIRDSWKKLAYAISEGVITHIISNIEIKGVETSGDINAAVSGSAATEAGVLFTQSNDGSGLVE
jgi:hypothetical protein